MTHQTSYAERALALKRQALASSGRGGAGADPARARRAGSADLNTRMRIGEGLDVDSGKMKVPIGAGLEIDRRGQIASSAGLEVVIARASSRTISTIANTYRAIDLSSVASSIGSGTISVDATNEWVRLEPGRAYLISAFVVISRTDSRSNVAHTVFAKIDRLDSLGDVAPPHSDLYAESSFAIKAAEPISMTIPMFGIVDLRSDSEAAAIQVMGKVDTLLTVNTPVIEGNIKIERIG